MTQEIKPTYVTREQAKWLKEKEFDLPTYAYYSGLNFYTGEYKNHSQTTIGDTPMHKMLIGYTSAPEQWQVIEWLRVNHGIHIEILLEENKPWNKFYYRIMKIGQYFSLSHDGIYSETPQEAYSTAFDYILNNLI
jgi:hypothetical protein